MANPKHTRIPIGRFSTMTRLSVKALRLYDAQGLLKPAHIDATSGYRYYHLEQAYSAEIIRVLRSIGMPLPEIQAVVEAEDDASLGERLQQHKARLVEQLQAQQAALEYLETMIESKRVVSPYEFQLVQEPAQPIAAVKIHTSLSKIAKDIQAGFGTLMRGLGQAGVPPSGAPMILYHNVIDQESSGDIEIVAPVAKTIADQGELYGRELEAGTMATTVHRGHYEGMARAYHALTQWISEQGYDITGPTREIYLNDPQTVAADALLTRLVFPVCTTDSEAQ